MPRGGCCKLGPYRREGTSELTEAVELFFQTADSSEVEKRLPTKLFVAQVDVEVT